MQAAPRRFEPTKWLGLKDCGQLCGETNIEPATALDLIGVPEGPGEAAALLEP